MGLDNGVVGVGGGKVDISISRLSLMFYRMLRSL